MAASGSQLALFAKQLEIHPKGRLSFAAMTELLLNFDLIDKTIVFIVVDQFSLGVRDDSSFLQLPQLGRRMSFPPPNGSGNRNRNDYQNDDEVDIPVESGDWGSVRRGGNF